MHKQEPFCVRLVFCVEALGGEEVVKMSKGRRQARARPCRPALWRRRVLPTRGGGTALPAPEEPPPGCRSPGR